MSFKNSNSIEYILRAAIFLTFFGHGVVAIKGNPNWIMYLQTVSFSLDVSTMLIKYIGVLDILVAITVVFKPNKYVVLWCVLWAFTTALIRPISGEDIWSFIERGDNWGAPLALYFLLKNKNTN